MIVYLSFGATIFGYSLWSRLLVRYAASQVVSLMLLVSVAGLVSTAALLSERLVSAQWLGGTAVMAGLLLSVLGGRLAAWQVTARPPHPHQKQTPGAGRYRVFRFTGDICGRHRIWPVSGIIPGLIPITSPAHACEQPRFLETT